MIMFEINPLVFELSNGIRVCFIKRNAFVGHLAIMFHAGSRFEKPEDAGLAHFVEHSLFKGTKNRNATQIFSELDSVGGEINAYTNKEEICVHASFRKIHLEIAADLLSDIVLNPTFPTEELRKEKVVITDEINSYLDSPSERIFDEFEELLYKGHPLGFNILGTKKSLKKIGQKEARDFVDRLFCAPRAVISIVGDFKIDELKSMLEAKFSSMPTSSGNSDFEAFENKSHIPFTSKQKRANYQTHLLYGGLAPVDRPEDRRTLTLIMNYLGGPAMNATLVLNIREKYGYAYNIEANFTPYSETGFWTIYAGTDPTHVKHTKELINEELDMIMSEGIANNKLAEAKEQLKGHIALSLDSNQELMFFAAKNLLFHNHVSDIAEIYEQVDSISNEEVKRLANEVFSGNSLCYLEYKLR